MCQPLVSQLFGLLLLPEMISGCQPIPHLHLGFVFASFNCLLPVFRARSMAGSTAPITVEATVNRHFKDSLYILCISAKAILEFT